MLNFQDLTKRIVVYSGVILIIIAILLFAFHPIVSWCVAVAVSLFGAVALWEFMRLTLLKQSRFFQGFVLVLGFIYIMLFFLTARHIVCVRSASFAMLFGIFVLFVVQFKGEEGSCNRIMASIFSLVYVVLPIALMLNILFSPNLVKIWGMDGRFFLVFLLATTKMTDVGAYFGGRLLGRKLLCVKLSPKKTWEGAVIGWVFAVLTSLLMTFIFKMFTGIHFSYQSAAILGALFGVLAQVGDLAESLFKREAGVKDSNRLPGIGGVLDMLDSLLFTTPLLALYIFT